MALKIASPPKQCLRLISDALDKFQSTPMEMYRESSLKAIPPKELDASLPHQVFLMGLIDVIEASLDKAQPIGWRYIVLRGEQPVAAAEIEGTEARRRLQFSNFNEGPFVLESVKGIALAEKLPEMEKEDFVLRLLRIPALYVMALWIHGDNREILIPLEPTHDLLVPNRKYTPTQFFRQLASAAEQRAEFDDTPS